MSTDCSNVIHLRPRADAPVQPFSGSPSPENLSPRASFGLKPRAEDRAAIDRIKALAREARNALDGRAVDPELIRDLAIEAGHIAQQCEALAAKAKSYGKLKAVNSLRDHAHHLETLSAELQAESQP